MARYNDTNGNTWNSAEEALEDFLNELPYLTEEETETVFQFTNHENNAADNLKAIAYGITYAGLDDRFEGDNYPVPAEAHLQTWEDMYDMLKALGVSEEALTLITAINGSSTDTMESTLYARFGYRSFDQLEGE
jgi:hypothetical protein